MVMGSEVLFGPSKRPELEGRAWCWRWISSVQGCRKCPPEVSWSQKSIKHWRPGVFRGAAAFLLVDQLLCPQPSARLFTHIVLQLLREAGNVISIHTGGSRGSEKGGLLHIPQQNQN